MTIAATRRRAGERFHGWFVVGAKYTFAAWFALCAYLALARAAHFAGHWYLPSRDDPYTASADISGGWPWAFPVTETIPAAAMLAAVGLVVSGGMFVTGYARGHRALTISMIGSTVAMLVVMVAALTPAGLAVSGWLID